MTSAEVLILRPQPGADETVAALAGHGIAARALPVLEIEPLPESPALRALVQRLDEFDLVVFTSPAAVREGMKWIDANWPQYPLRMRVLAVGARTRELLAEWGLDARSPADHESAEGLLELPELAPPGPAASGPARVLIVRGEGGRELLARELQARGLRVEHLVVYRRVQCRIAVPVAERVAALVASSADGVDALVASDGLRLRERPLIVPSERVARRARELGFARVRVAAGAGPDATRAALAALGINGSGSAGPDRGNSTGVQQ